MLKMSDGLMTNSHYLLTGLAILKPPPVKWGLLLSWGRGSSCSTVVLVCCSLMRHTELQDIKEGTQLPATVYMFPAKNKLCILYPTIIPSDKCLTHLWSFFWLRYFFLMFASSLAKLWFSLLYSFILESSILSSAINACGIRERKNTILS